ncbi:phosphoribosylformylglycinamidine synthase subunit PurL [Candidatus Marinamargulisbacteria bacterium SCGC AG-439-L15]|nr:phosphoribosylformylglycinamidine synthase subunit PurL [Candidatus Marinamargulisbacteria bacterium SCGC AG-439-L15]
MALSKQDLSDIKDLLGRDPSKVEEIVFDTMWSEHCSYKSSKPTLKTLPTEGSEVVLGVGEDSGIVFFTAHDGKKYCIAVSHESHNHPSQVLPVEGAATGVGGVVRDVYCMGADVIGVLDSLHFGVPDGSDSDGLVSEIAERVVYGVSDYGNPLGVPVLGGETLYHPSYNENCLVNVAALGLVEQPNIIRSRVPQEAKDEPYDMILIGKSTDATGFGGASFSSAVLDKEDEMTNMGAVQVHDPFLKRVIVEALKVLFVRAQEKKIPIGLKDLGAGGISCAASELAVAGGFGVDIRLDDVNVVSEALLPEVIACSETQERFCLAVPRHFSKEAIDIFNKEFELPKLYHKAGASIIGEIIPEQRFIMHYRDEKVCDLDVKAITTEVSANREARVREKGAHKSEDLVVSTETLTELCTQTLSTLNGVSKRYVYRFFDNAVRGDTVVYPGEADAVVVTPVPDCDTALAVSMDSNLYGNVDPYVSGAAAVAESVRNVVAVGGRPMAVTDCLNYGSPEVPEVFYDFQEGVRGIGDAARALSFIDQESLPIISGNVSFYNESTSGNAVVPSPVIVALGRLSSYKKALTMQLREADSSLILIGERFQEFGGTQVEPLIALSGASVSSGAPQVRFAEEAKQNKSVHDLIEAEKIRSCHDISGGGLWQCLSEMCLGERGTARVGAVLSLPETANPLTWLFSENGGYVIEVSPQDLEAVQTALSSSDVWFYHLGHTQSERTISVSQASSDILSISLDQLKSDWNTKNSASVGTRT